MTDDQIAKFVATVNDAIADSGMTPDEVVGVLAGIYAEAATAAWGPVKAAQQTYVLALRLARRAGPGP